MVKYLIGDEISETFLLESEATGETFTFINPHTPGVGSWSGPTITEIGGGEYEVTFTPDTLGIWRVGILGNTTGELFNGSWPVVDTPSPVYERRITGGVIRSTDINELQQGLEQVRKMLGLI